MRILEDLDWRLHRFTEEMVKEALLMFSVCGGPQLGSPIRMMEGRKAWGGGREEKGDEVNMMDLKSMKMSAEVEAAVKRTRAALWIHGMQTPEPSP